MINYDERIGCVVVYRGQRRNCLLWIEESPDCLFYRHGYQRNGIWYVKWRHKLMAKCLYWWWRFVCKKATGANLDG